MSDQRGKTLAIVAASMPPVFVAGSCAWFYLDAALHRIPGHMLQYALDTIRELSVGSALVLGGVLTGVIALPIVLYMSARGSRIPAAVVVLVASLPWLGALATYAMALGSLEEALTGGEPAT